MENFPLTKGILQKYNFRFKSFTQVIAIFEGKERRGKKPKVEYLIHFQGWSSSWDRRVSEKYVLKDTEDNRQLQKDLADKAQLQM